MAPILLCAQVLPGKGKGQGQGTTVSDSTRKDTTTTDSLQKPAKKIDPLTERVYLEGIELGELGRRQEQYRIDEFLEWNPTDSLGGFTQSLGQIGKPYRRYHFGAPSYFFQEGQYTNPITLHEEAYIINSESQVRYFDSRTPYFNVQYHQGRRKLQLLHVTLSQNVTPLWNVTGFFRNRRVTGGYLENDGRQTLLYLSSNFHTWDHRYHAFGHITFSELSEADNGGAYLDETTSYEELFNKNLTRTSLQDTRFTRRQKALFFKHFYQLRSDSVLTGQSLVFFNSAKYEDFYHQYGDAVFATTLQTQFLPLYVTMDSGATSVLERMSTRNWRVDAGARYNLKFRKNKLSVGAEAAYENYLFVQEGRRLLFDRTTYTLKPILRLNESFLTGRIEAESRISEAALFAAERRNSITGEIELPVALQDYIDTTFVRKGRKQDTLTTRVTYRPIIAGAKFIEYSRNPSYLETWYLPGENNLYTANPDLVNRNFQHISGTLGWQGKEMSKRGIRNGRNQARVTGFYSRQGRMIYRDTSFALRQAPEGEALNSLGAETFVRLKWRRLSLESNNTFQAFTAPTGSELAFYYSDHLPNFFGKTGLYYENNDVNIAAVIRAGVEAHYNTAFYGEWYDPIHQEFYPQRKLDAPAYTRFDVFFSTRIKTALIYAKYIHANEGLFLPGYFYTPLYPMLEGSFLVGVNWTFFE